MSVLASFLLLPLAMLCSAVSFPAMLFERALPRMPPVERLKWDDDESWFHNLKNISTEFMRADPQWWSKFLCFCILVLICVSIL